MKDFYAILGIERSASAEEVQAAYRDLAKALHPDVNPRGAGLMRDVNEAYQTLKDPAKRRSHDLQSKVRQFTRPAEQMAREAVQPNGAVDLLKLAEAFIPANVRAHALPSLGRLLQDRGITPEAATVEQFLQATGILKPERKRRAKRA